MKLDKAIKKELREGANWLGNTLVIKTKPITINKKDVPINVKSIKEKE